MQFGYTQGFWGAASKDSERAFFVGFHDPMTVVTRGSTYDNLVNLAPGYVDRMRRKYEGTRLGRQELYAEILEDTPGALWTHALLERARVRNYPQFRSRHHGKRKKRGHDTVIERGYSLIRYSSQRQHISALFFRGSANSRLTTWMSCCRIARPLLGCFLLTDPLTP